MSKRDVIVSLTTETLHQAGLLASRRGISVHDFLAEQIELLVRNEEAYDHAKLQALALLNQGFHLGGVRIRRDELHNRE